LPSPAIKLGKPDVHLYLYLDKDAYANDMKHFTSGGGVQFGGKTSGGTPLKLCLDMGRDTAGGGAGFITLQIGPRLRPDQRSTDTAQKSAAVDGLAGYRHT
jgi:hypothetical protein